MHRAIVLVSLLSCVSGAALAQSAAELERKARIEAIAGTQTPETLARKARSEKLLRENGVATPPPLPVYQGAAASSLRDTKAVAYRAAALIIVALKAEGLEQDPVDDLIVRNEMQERFTPEEQAFVDDPAPSDADRAKFGWRHEAACTLLWSLGYWPQLDRPTAICDAKRAVLLLRDHGVSGIIKRAHPRPLADALDEADLAYRYHWLARRVPGDSIAVAAPAWISLDVVFERHYALNWLVGYMGQDWDDVTPDT